MSACILPRFSRIASAFSLLVPAKCTKNRSVFCEMLKNHDNLFSAFVKYEMPWMAYLALYFNSCSAKEYENEFNYLLLENGFSNEKYVKLALRNYHIASFVMGFIKMMSKIKNR